MPRSLYPHPAYVVPPYDREMWSGEGRYVPVDYMPADRVGPPMSGVHYGPYGPMPAPTGPLGGFGQVAPQQGDNTMLWLVLIVVVGLVAYYVGKAAEFED